MDDLQKELERKFRIHEKVMIVCIVLMGLGVAAAIFAHIMQLITSH